MPFMKGRAAVRRTLQYLEKGTIQFRENIEIMTINYNMHHKGSSGTHDFVFWHLAQIKYKNPQVQIVTLKNMTPSPFITFFLHNGKRILVDCDSRKKDEILDHIQSIMCKTEEDLAAERLAKLKEANPANIGYGYSKWCICEIPGQVPCPGWVPLPKTMRGRHTVQQKDVQVES